MSERENKYALEDSDLDEVTGGNAGLAGAQMCPEGKKEFGTFCGYNQNGIQCLYVDIRTVSNGKKELYCRLFNHRIGDAVEEAKQSLKKNGETKIF